MPPMAQMLMVAGFLCFAASMGLACLAWPRLKALEARGVIRRPVPDLMDEHRQHRVFSLIWMTPIPKDRMRLRRLLLVIRLLLLTAPLLMLAGVLVMANRPTPTGASSPAVTVDVPVEEPAR